MKLVYVLLAFAGLSASAQTGDALTAQGKYNDELHFRARRVVEAEQARARQPLCPRASSTVDVISCYANELGITDGNYLTLVGVIESLLRGSSAGSAEEKPALTPFNQAEATWHTYRDQACSTAGHQSSGGADRPSVELGCRLTLTRHHMDELWVVYGDLGEH